MKERTAQVVAPLALALFALLGVLMTSQPAGGAVAAAVVVTLVGVVLAARRVTGWPMLLGLAVATASFAYLGHAQSANLAWMGLCVVAGWAALTSATSVAVPCSVAVAAVPVAEWFLDRSEPGWGAWFVGIAFTTVACVSARRLRLTVGQLREAQAALAERTRWEERTRIAAEVHDVIGHALTVSLLHVSSARLALDDAPGEARRSLEEAERLTRESLEEVRATVGLMRGDAPDQTAPLPGAVDIPTLVESFRRVGADIDLELTGDPSTLGPSRGLTAYRIVQEALTNATRHAPGQPVLIRVVIDTAGATMTVHNSAASGAAAAPGAGLRGMTERAEGAGGRLVAGPTSTGWVVEAVVPA